MLIPYCQQKSCIFAKIFILFFGKTARKLSVETNEIIKHRRKELGLTLQQVADIVGVSKSTILRYETKEISSMTANVLPPLAKALNCTESYLLGLTKNPNEFEQTLQLSLDETALLNWYRKVPIEIQNAVKVILSNCAKQL